MPSALQKQLFFLQFISILRWQTIEWISRFIEARIIESMISYSLLSLAIDDSEMNCDA